MSVKTMITKLALAFAAKKGMEVLQSSGGIEGLTRSLSSRGAAQPAESGMDGRIGGTQSASAGGLGNILGSLGIGGATDGREGGIGGQISPANSSLGQLFGTLAAAVGGGAVPNNTNAGQELDRQFEIGDEIEQTGNARPVVMAMVQMARADGSIDDAEQRALMEFLDDASETEQKMVRDALNDRVDANAIAQETPPRARKEVYAAAMLVGRPENERERQFLNNLQFALDLSADEVNQLHHAMGLGRVTV